jgi:hypothetical protein
MDVSGLHHLRRHRQDNGNHTQSDRTDMVNGTCWKSLTGKRGFPMKNRVIRLSERCDQPPALPCPGEFPWPVRPQGSLDILQLPAITRMLFASYPVRHSAGLPCLFPGPRRTNPLSHELVTRNPGSEGARGGAGTGMSQGFFTRGTGAELFSQVFSAGKNNIHSRS